MSTKLHAGAATHESAEAKEEKSAAIAVIAFPAFILIGAFIAFLVPEPFIPIGAYITPMLAVIMFCMGLTPATLPQPAP